MPVRIPPRSSLLLLRDALRVIGEFEERGERAHESKIAEAINVHPVETRRILNRLAKDDLVTTVDLAASVFVLTMKGIDAYDDLKQSRWDRFRKYGISRAEGVLIAIVTSIAVLAAERILGL